MREVNESEFVAAVLEASNERPIVVDFWSQHCPPCHVLSPVLESLEVDANGAWELVTINVDDNPQLADDYRVMSIPAVKAFVDGEVVDAFVGAWPRNRLQEWLADVVPSEDDKRLRAARLAEDNGDGSAAAAGYAAVIEAQPQRHEARLGLARIALAQADVKSAAAHLDAIGEQQWPELGGQAEAIWLQLVVAALEPTDDEREARYQRGIELAAAGEVDAGLTELLALVAEDPDWRDGLAGRAMIRIMAIMGEKDPRVVTWRSRLGRMLYR